MANAYSKLYNIPSTGLRFFTVYGCAGRPDMFYYSATQCLLKGETIQSFNYGNCKRDFTYIDDSVEGVVRVMQGAPEKKNGKVVKQISLPFSQICGIMKASHFAAAESNIMVPAPIGGIIP